MVQADVFSDLQWRGFVQQATPGLEAHLRSGHRTVYCGFDPTAPSMQVGNAMPLMLLAHLQRSGHQPIVLMGGGTGLIGDPSGKSTERPLLEPEVIKENLQRQRDQTSRFLDFDPGPQAALVLDNARWLVPAKLVEFLRDVGKHFTVNIMLQKESVNARLESGLSYTEFSYMLLQAYDFLQLHRTHKCTIQVGGSDQWGNITAGVDLIRRVGGAGAEAHGFVAPLITTASGKKFGKTEGGAVWLDPAMTSPYQFYQFWINTDDRDVARYLRIFTFQSRSEIEDLVARHEKNPAAREAQSVLARSLTALVHGDAAAEGVVGASRVLFGEFDPRAAGPAVFEILAKEIPTFPIARSLPLADAIVSTELAKSKGEARRAIEQGGIYVNNQRADVSKTITDEDWIGQHLLLRKGKKEYALARSA
jgi:tyrosyl-tRNA synthetase